MLKVKIMNDFKLNLRSTIISFFTLLLLSSLFFNAYAKSNDEKIQNTEHKSKDAIDKELAYLDKGIKYDGYKSDSKVELTTKKIDKPQKALKDNAIDKELEYLSKGIKYENSKNKLIGQIYLRTDLGFSKLQTNAYNDKFCINKCIDKGYNLGKAYNFGIGWYINNDYRIDLLYNTASLKFNYDQQIKTNIINYKHKVDISTLMLNLYRYQSISKYFDIYIGGGVGYTRISPEDGIRTYNNNQKDILSAKPSNNFSYSLTTGTSLKVTNNIELNLGYRFLNYGKIKGFDNISSGNPHGYRKSIKPVKSNSLKGHNFTLGIIYKLPNKSL